jgi:GNAT superfamily N-acetyltransferase
VKPRRVEIDGVGTAIRPMGLDYVIAAQEPAGISVEIGCRAAAAIWPNPLYVAYYSKLTEAYGSCAILAWQGSAVVGFLPFRPRECGLPDLPYCIHYAPGASAELDKPDADAVTAAVPIPFADLGPKELQVHCLSVKPSLRRRGLGSALVRYLIDWAREQGWERIEGGFAFAEGGYGWLPNIAFWEGLGFTREAPRMYDGRDPIEGKPGFGFGLDLRRPV